jgi:Undecaprenyl-phosphate glucose phosphotransferase
MRASFPKPSSVSAMTTLTTGDVDLASREREVMNPYAFGLDPPRTRSRRILGAIDAWYSDKRNNISRPKLLFTVSLADALAVAASGLLAALAMGGADMPRMAVVSPLAALVTIAVLRRNWSYTISALRHTSAQIEKVAKSIVAVLCMGAGAAYIAGIELASPGTALLWLALVLASLIAVRLAAARIVDHLAEAGRLVRRTVIVGGGPEAEMLIEALEREGSKHLQILGIFDDRSDERSSDSIRGYAKLGNFEQLVMFCRNAAVDLLIVTVPVAAEQRLLQILERLFTLNVDVRISALSSKLRLNSAAYAHVGRVPMLAVMDKPLTDWDRVLKNIEDKILGTLLLLIAAPVMALVAVAIRLDSKGPIFFKQRRFGFDNELIEVFKFRSLRADAADLSADKLVTKDDARLTRVGRFIRRTSLDELPQLFNVLRGEMSLVGPRPHAAHAKAERDLYQAVVAGYFARHRVKPGITGWAQVNGWRGETDTHEKIQRRVELDLYYIDNWSVLFDLYIIALTPLALLSQRNAY